MKTTFGEPLPRSYYMLWRVGKDDTVDSIVEYFKNRHGYQPTDFLVGDGVELEFPPASEVKSIFVSKGHVQVR